MRDFLTCEMGEDQNVVQKRVGWEREKREKGWVKK